MTVDSTSSPRRRGARELTRLAMTKQIAGLAIDLFVENGFENTTIEEICSVAGISRTTFFRYFRTKEDVLLRDFEGLGTQISDMLSERPDDEAPWMSLRRAITPLYVSYDSDDPQTRRALKVIIESPSLFGFHQEKLSRWLDEFRPEVARRLGVAPDDLLDPAPDALITSAFACMDAALAAWVRAEGALDLEALLDRSMGVFDETPKR